MIDKRVFDRLEVNLPCTLALPNDVRTFEARILDLSLTGMRLVTNFPLRPGQTVYFSFVYEMPVKGQARVIWCRQGAKGCEAGLEISHLKKRFKDALQKIIQELTLQNLADSYCR